MRIAIAGKGGTGKTTIAGTLARVLAQRGRRVLAIDADTNPNLATTLGISADRVQSVTALPRNLIERRTADDGTTKLFFTASPDEVIDQYGARAPDDIQLLVMGKVDHGGVG